MASTMRTLAFAALAIAALAQDASGPTFEVVSVKPSAGDPGRLGRGIFTFPGGRIRANQCPLYYLITQAFEIQSFQIVGGPRWIHEDRFDIDAKPPAGSNASRSNPRNPNLPPNPEQRLMLQALLADRFHLRYHRETREGPVYLLVRTGKPLNLQPAKDPNQYPWVGGVAGGAITGDGLAATNATMALVATRLSGALERPVIDRTGLTGAFDFKAEYRTGDPNPDLISSLLASVQPLGLKLAAAKGPVETLVIDSAEKPQAN
jgi:uncharacterized protein (TIGR03435 family)